MNYDSDIEPSVEEIAYHDKMHRLYKVVRNAMSDQLDQLPAVFSKQVRRLELAVPPWPDFEEAA